MNDREKKHERRVQKFLANDWAKREKRRKRKQMPKSARRSFYLSKAWRELRRRVLKTYGWKCMCCRTVDGPMHVDHIQPRSKAPHLELVFDNMQVLCESCNTAKSNIHAEDYREGAASEELDRQTYLEALSMGL